MTGSLRVTPEKLISTAQGFQTTAGTIGRLTSNMLSTVESLNSTWAGEAATGYYSKAKNLQPSIQKMLSMIKEHVQDLNDMARNYQEAERTAQSNAEALNPDVIH